MNQNLTTDIHRGFSRSNTEERSSNVCMFVHKIAQYPVMLCAVL